MGSTYLHGTKTVRADEPDNSCMHDTAKEKDEKKNKDERKER